MDAAPTRPDRIPADAVYAGGIDGGEWLRCGDAGDGATRCEIFDRVSGDLRYESWFRYCPNVSGPAMPLRVGVERGLLVSQAWLRRDRLDVFHPPANTTLAEIEREHELIEKYYRDFGVNRSCEANEGTITDQQQLNAP